MSHYRCHTVAKCFDLSGVVVDTFSAFGRRARKGLERIDAQIDDMLLNGEDATIVARIDYALYDNTGRQRWVHSTAE